VLHHVVKAQGEVVVVNGKLLVPNGNLQCMAVPRALQVIPIGDGGAQSRVAAEGNACPCSGLRADKVMGGAGVEERGEPNIMDINVELHGTP
jgi:hypothetical protein